ncbi:MAG: cyclase family protein [Breznakibacter sp.]
MNIIDLTHTLTSTSPVYPGDAPMLLSKIADYTAHGYNNSEIRTGMHVGTHIDGPLHMLEHADTIDKLPLAKLTGEAIVFNVTEQTELILSAEIRSAHIANKIVLLRSDFSNRYYQPGYYTDHPVLSEELADYLVLQGIKMLGIDFPSPDRAPYAVHPKLFAQGIPIIENLTNLSLLAGYRQIDIIALPLKIEADSAPARVIAIVDNNLKHKG